MSDTDPPDPPTSTRADGGGGEAAPEVPPFSLPDLRLVREIGRGGMGVVYEAEQISLGRRVALKVLRGIDALAPELRERFLREARTAAALHHTHIVPVHAVGSHAGVDYYVMQLIVGRSLVDVLRQDGPADPRTAARWGLQAVEALAHAHSRGVVHRDIKPSNLLVDQGGHLWLTDFGLAQVAELASLTPTGGIMGTPLYMSPEQARADRVPVDHRTDIYSLGATLYELLTGRATHDGQPAEVVLARLAGAEPVPVRQRRPDVPADLETILLRCLQNDPADRYPDALALADDLRAFLQGRPVRAQRPALVARAGRWLRRHRLQAAVALVAALLTLAVSVGGPLAWVLSAPYRLGQLQLTSDPTGPALTAELFDEEERPLAPPQTLPMHAPELLPPGPAWLRVSSSGRLSETYRLDVEAGAVQRGTAELQGQVLASVERPQRGGGHFLAVPGGLFLLGQRDVRCLDAGGQQRWEARLASPRAVPPTHPFWNDPEDALQAPVDLDGDGVPDLVLAVSRLGWPWAGHFLPALSGRTGAAL